MGLYFQQNNTLNGSLQQFREALPGDHPYRFVIHDRDSIFTEEVDQGLTNLGVRVLRTALVQNGSVMKDHGRMHRFVSVEALFNGRHFDRQIIILYVSWYTSFKLSFRDLVIMMADRGISLAHTTILRWVQHYLPEFEKRWKLTRALSADPGGWMKHI